MRKSKEEAEQTRKRIVKSAAARFRKNGIVATGLSDLMKTAGLTHGGFYKHFDSKDQLIDEAVASAIDETVGVFVVNAAARPGLKGLQAAVARYLSDEHVQNPEIGCTFGALAAEIGRADSKTRRTATDGFAIMVNAILPHFTNVSPAEAKQSAIAAAVTMIGAVTMARMVTDPALAKAILDSARHTIVRSAT